VARPALSVQPDRAEVTSFRHRCPCHRRRLACDLLPSSLGLGTQGATRARLWPAALSPSSRGVWSSPDHFWW
jgi:hypothetical protein